MSLKRHVNLHENDEGRLGSLGALDRSKDDDRLN